MLSIDSMRLRYRVCCNDDDDDDEDDASDLVSRSDKCSDPDTPPDVSPGTFSVPVVHGARRLFLPVMLTDHMRIPNDVNAR